MVFGMTSKERLTAALLGREVDHVPFAPFLAFVWEHFPTEVQQAGIPAFHKQIGADLMWRGAACCVNPVYPDDVRTTEVDEGDCTRIITETPVGRLEFLWRKSTVPGQMPFLAEHPLKTEEDYKVQLYIEEHTTFQDGYDGVRQWLTEGEGREGLTIGLLFPRGKSAFQQYIEHYAGTEEATFALADFSETVETLIETMVAKDLEAARIAAATPGVDFFISWEDSSTQNYSPAMYQKYIGAELRQICELLASHGKHYIQHACGHVKAILPAMKAAGARAVESLSTPPTGNITLREARAIAGAEMGIIGGIEPTRFLNTPLNDLGGYVESVIADLAGGPFVLANSDSCPPGVTVEKFARVAEVARNSRG